MKKKIILYLFICIGFVSLITPAYARSTNFVPVLGDITSANQGPERVFVTEEGSLSVVGYGGEMVAGFPYMPQDMVIVSSPVFIDGFGDRNYEIGVVTKNILDGNYSFSLINNAGTLVQNSIIGTHDIYYDPVVVNGNMVITADVLGNIYQVKNGGIENILQLGHPVGVAYLESGELVINYPQIAKLEVYTQNEAGNWGLQRTLNVSSPIIYPVIENGEENYLGVTEDGHGVKIQIQTGSFVEDFAIIPVGMPIAKPFVLDVSAENIGEEIIIQCDNKKQYIYSQEGLLLDTKENSSFLESSVVTKDTFSQNFWSDIRENIISIWNSATRTLVSIFSRIKIIVTDLDPNVFVSYNQNEITSGANISLGSIALDTENTFSFILDIQNNGEMNLMIQDILFEDTNNGVFTAGDIGNGVIQKGEHKQVEIIGTPIARGEVSGKIIVKTNDPDTGIFVLHITASPYKNLVVDGNMEDVTYTWRRWGTPVEWNKTANEQYAGLYSLYLNSTNVHSGIQQLNVPVEAGKSYKLSMKYKLNSGTMYSILGIRNSNSDFEGKVEKILMNGNEWGNYEREFTVPNDFVSDFRIRVSIQNGIGYIDNIIIEEIEELPIVKDGDFELAGVTYWKGWGGSTNWRKSQSQVYAGVNSLEIGDVNNTNGGVYQNYIPLEKGKMYQFSFWYRVDSGALYNIVGDAGVNADVEGVTKKFGITNGVWKQYTRIISGDLFTRNNPSIRFSVRTGHAWIDNVLIEEIATETAQNEKILDGNMEFAQLGNWQAYGTPEVLEKTQVDIHSGVSSLHVRTKDTGEYDYAGVQYGNISVEAGKTYTLGFWYKTNGSIISRLGIGDSNNDFEIPLENTVELQKSPEWTYYERNFTVPQNFSGDFRFVVRVQDWFIDHYETQVYEGVTYENVPVYGFVPKGELWLDDVSIMEITQ
ncbi:MAG: carbohydrate binding domain-containing protein [Candidatus Magasanikbacteria bacterium]